MEKRQEENREEKPMKALQNQYLKGIFKNMRNERGIKKGAQATDIKACSRFKRKRND